MKKTIPAVSIVIPMYNAEKYIGECLDSIFAQTFTDYEVIVVDDCSTDNSRAVVQSYLPKFDGGGVKLNIICRKINSGNPAFPTNEGIEFSRGEYLLFLDNDDMLKMTALEELYPLAKKFDADVVHCERYYQFNDGKKNLTLKGYQSGELVKKPTFLSENLIERIQELSNGRFIVNLWSKLIRRDFLIETRIKLVSVLAQDVLFTFCIVLKASRYLRVPNVVNIYRMLESSLSHKKDDVPKKFSKVIVALVDGFNYLDNFLNEIEFFKNRPDAKFFVLSMWINDRCNYLIDVYSQIPAWQLDEIIRREFEKFNANPSLTGFLFSRMNIFNVNLNRQGALIQQMNAHIQKQNEVIQRLQSQLANK